MAAISETLRQARLRSGIDLERLADKTKINPRYLQAIEAGDFGKLPSGIFARMFVKQYADAVGLDGAVFAEEFQRSMSYGYDSGTDILSIAAARRDYHPSVPGLSSVGDRVKSERIASMLSSFIWVVAAILVCSAVYYGLTHLPSRTALTVMAPTAPKPAEAQVPAQRTDSENTVPKAPVAASPASPGAPAAALPSSGPPPVSGAIQLAIATSEPVWVTVVADGKSVVSEIMPAGSSKIVAATASARVTLGNAGGAEITFNGKKLEPLGPKGQVRTAEFTTDSFQVISRTSKADPSANPDPLR